MSEKWDELTQLEVAYKALCTQPHEARIRMLEYLKARIDHEHIKDQEAIKERVRARGKQSNPGGGK